MKKLLICLLALMLTVPALAEAPGGLRPRRDDPQHALYRHARDGVSGHAGGGRPGKVLSCQLLRKKGWRTIE